MRQLHKQRLMALEELRQSFLFPVSGTMVYLQEKQDLKNTSLRPHLRQENPFQR